MPRYQYPGESPCRYGTDPVVPGQIVRASSRPGKRFVLIYDEPQEPFDAHGWDMYLGREEDGSQTLEVIRQEKFDQALGVIQQSRSSDTGVESDFTIMSAGLLHEADFSEMPYYTSLGQVVVQCWCDQNANKIPLLPGVSVVQTPGPILPDSIARDDMLRFSYQVMGIRLGLEKCNTRYTIRVRNDEHFTDLSELIRVFLLDTRRIVASNIFWGKPLFIGDHVFVAETDLLKGAYDRLCRQVLLGVPLKENQPSPEYALLSAFIEASRAKYPPWKTDEMIIDRADVVPISRFGNYLVINHPEPSKGDGGVRRWTQENPCDYEMITTSSQLIYTPIVLY